MPDHMKRTCLPNQVFDREEDGFVIGIMTDIFNDQQITFAVFDFVGSAINIIKNIDLLKFRVVKQGAQGLVRAGNYDTT